MFWSLAVLFAVVSAFADASFVQPTILGGRAGSIIDIPHQALIQAVGRHICGGTLISKNHILTSAACLKPYLDLLSLELFEARVGSTFRYKSGWLYKFAKIVASPDFVYESNDCDVSVAITKDPVSLSIAVRPIVLATKEQAPKQGDVYQISGWGLKKESEADNYMETLEVATIPFTDIETCRSVYQYFRRNITENMFCAGLGTWGGGTAAYKGDAGGPVSRNGLQLVGIMSWGEPVYPSVFTSINSPKVRGFIESVLKG